MKKLTHQQMFSRAVTGVVKQGALSVEHGSCRYTLRRNGKTLHCGVGHLIASDLYTSDIEGEAVTHATPDSHFFGDRQTEALALALIFSGVDVTNEKTRNFLEEIQDAHDGAKVIPQFIEKCAALAIKHRLKMPKLRGQK